MTLKSKPHLLRRTFAYLAGAVVFTFITEIIIQVISLVRTGTLLTLDETRIACIKFTFLFLLFGGFILVSIGHWIISKLPLKTQAVKRRHALAYATGYILFVVFGIILMSLVTPEIVTYLLEDWWVILAAFAILFGSAFIAGRAFAQVYEGSAKLS